MLLLNLNKKKKLINIYDHCNDYFIIQKIHVKIYLMVTRELTCYPTKGDLDREIAVKSFPRFIVV